jgi:hypothetical protein
MRRTAYLGGVREQESGKIAAVAVKIGITA